MYEQFFGLRERPFELTSNATYVVMTSKHQEALSVLQYGISTGHGITLLLGAAGTGKTTMLRRALGRRTGGVSEEGGRWVCLNNPGLTRQEFLDTLANGFQLSPEASTSKSRFLRELERVLFEHHAHGRVAGLVVDEAQSAPTHVLEELRLLSNLESESAKLLRVILVGQPALARRLNDPELSHLKQRIGVRSTLPALSLQETAIYVARRITLAGGTPDSIFTRDGVLAIHDRSGGIPRTINVICHNALLTGFAADRRPVDAELVFEVCRDFDLQYLGVLPAATRQRNAGLRQAAAR
jgi:general secretion pathway protein A